MRDSPAPRTRISNAWTPSCATSRKPRSATACTSLVPHPRDGWRRIFSSPSPGCRAALARRATSRSSARWQWTSVSRNSILSHVTWPPHGLPTGRPCFSHSQAIPGATMAIRWNVLNCSLHRCSPAQSHQKTSPIRRWSCRKSKRASDQRCVPAAVMKWPH